MPQTTVLYEALSAFLVPATWAQMLMLTVASDIAYGIESTVIHAADVPTLIARLGMVTMLGVYVPALALVLRRPNDGVVPRWLERGVDRASAPVRELVRRPKILDSLEPSTARKLTCIALIGGIAVLVAASFYHGFVT